MVEARTPFMTIKEGRAHVWGDFRVLRAYYKDGTFSQFQYNYAMTQLMDEYRELRNAPNQQMRYIDFLVEKFVNSKGKELV